VEHLIIDRADGDDVCVVTPVGQLDVATAPRLRQVLTEAQFGPAHTVVLDLDRVEYLDAIGVGVIVDAHHRARTHDARFVVACGRERLLRVLADAGLDQVLEIVPQAPAV